MVDDENVPTPSWSRKQKIGLASLVGLALAGSVGSYFYGKHSQEPPDKVVINEAEFKGFKMGRP